MCLLPYVLSVLPGSTAGSGRGKGVALVAVLAATAACFLELTRTWFSGEWNASAQEGLPGSGSVCRRVRGSVWAVARVGCVDEPSGGVGDLFRGCARRGRVGVAMLEVGARTVSAVFGG